MSKVFEWNQKLYDQIEKKVNENMPVFSGKLEYKITDDKYLALVREVEEVYLTHPDGPYKIGRAHV